MPGPSWPLNEREEFDLTPQLWCLPPMFSPHIPHPIPSPSDSVRYEAHTVMRYASIFRSLRAELSNQDSGAGCNEPQSTMLGHPRLHFRPPLLPHPRGYLFIYMPGTLFVPPLLYIFVAFETSIGGSYSYA